MKQYTLDGDYVVLKKGTMNELSCDMIMQVAWPHLIGEVRYFGIKQAESARKKFITQASPYTLGKATGYRIYVRYIGTLNSFDSSEIDNFDELTRQVTAEMADYYASIMTDGMRRHCADE